MTLSSININLFNRIDIEKTDDGYNVFLTNRFKQDDHIAKVHVRNEDFDIKFIKKGEIIHPKILTRLQMFFISL